MYFILSQKVENGSLSLCSSAALVSVQLAQ
jgi:hypothetical protein